MNDNYQAKIGTVSASVSPVLADMEITDLKQKLADVVWMLGHEWRINNPDEDCMPDFVVMAQARRAAVAGVGQTIDQILAEQKVRQ